MIWRRKIENFFAFLLSLSFIFSWWKISSNAAITSLYIFPPKMIEMHSTYGSIISLPSLLSLAFTVVLLLIMSSIALTFLNKISKFSFIPAAASILIFIYALHKFAGATVGGIFGSGIIKESYAEWGLGIGFYLALLSFILLTGKVIYNEIRRGS